MSKIIFLPAEPYVGTKMLPISGKIHTAVGTERVEAVHALFATIEAPAIGTHFYDVMHFLGGCGKSSNVDDDMLAARFWNRSVVIDWIEANCRGKVLIQCQTLPMRPNSWRIGFVYAADHERFETWIRTTIMKGVFEFVVTEPVYNEMCEWAQDNLRKDYEVTRVGYGGAIGEVRARVKILDLVGATAFKIRWHGIDKDGR